MGSDSFMDMGCLWNRENVLEIEIVDAQPREYTLCLKEFTFVNFVTFFFIEMPYQASHHRGQPELDLLRGTHSRVISPGSEGAGCQSKGQKCLAGVLTPWYFQPTKEMAPWAAAGGHQRRTQ